MAPKMAQSLPLSASLVILTAVLFICAPLVFASQRSINLDANGLYKGLVVGFSSDFTVAESYRATLVKNVMVSENLVDRTPTQLNRIFVARPAKCLEHSQRDARSAVQ